MKKAAIKQNSTYLMESYKHLRNKVNSLKRNLRESIFPNWLQENIGNLKETWKIVNSFLNKTYKTTKIDTIKVEDKIVTDKNEIPNIMNKYFCNVNESLKKEIPNKPNPLFNGIYNVNRDSKEFRLEISEEEIISVISTFKTSKGSGPDSIPNFFIKIAVSVIARPLAFLFNSSLFQGVFLNNWKHARVSPTFKDGSTEELSNYRPISVLPFLSRLFEKLVYCRLYKYLDCNGLIYRHQSGFRSPHSVASCLLSNTNEWYQNIDKNKWTGLVFIDLKKAFDTVDTKLPLEKLAHYRIRNVEQRWFASYLTSRRQFCRVNGKLSSMEYISCGVPQGSCLGPLLFLLFINDMPYSLTKVKVNVYADNTSLTYSDVKLDNVT